MSIAGLLNQTITISNQSGLNDDGSLSYSAGRSAKSRFQPKQKRVLVADGSVLVVDAIAFLLPSETIATDDKVTYNAIDYKVLDVYEVPDQNGDTHHLELRLIKWRA